MKPKPQEKTIDHHEKGVDVPYEQIDPETLRNMVQEFVTRNGSDWGDPGGALEDKIAQVLKQLKNKQVKVVFDLKSETANIVSSL
jgi:uncharacterized protein YheU (UPF0270 family)